MVWRDEAGRYWGLVPVHHLALALSARAHRQTVAGPRGGLFRDPQTSDMDERGEPQEEVLPSESANGTPADDPGGVLAGERRARPTGTLSTMLQHVALEIRPEQLQECADLYRLLGFEEVDPPETIADRAVWMERKGTQLHLLKTEEPTVLPSGHLAVVAEDYEATMAALEQAGHRPDHRSRHWGAPRAFVKDPAGNLVEVMAWPPG